MDAATVMARCDALQAHTEEPGKLTRRFATPALEGAMTAVERWMREAGLTTAPRRGAQPVRALRGRPRRRAGVPARLPPRLGARRRPLRRAARRADGAGRGGAVAARGERLPFALEVCAFSDEESRPLRHHLPRLLRRGGRVGRRLARPRRPRRGHDARRAARRRRRPRRASRPASATRPPPPGGSSSTSSRGPRSSRKGCRSASSPASRPRCATAGRCSAPPATPARRRWPGGATRSPRPPPRARRRADRARRCPTWSPPSASSTPSRAR